MLPLGRGHPHPRGQGKQRGIRHGRDGWRGCGTKVSGVDTDVEKLRALEDLEMARDLAAYREAKSADDGTRVSLEELLADPA